MGDRDEGWHLCESCLEKIIADTLLDLVVDGKYQVDPSGVFTPVAEEAS